MTTKSSWIQRAKVRMKVLVPIGVTLTPGETLTLSEMYHDDVKTLENNSRDVAKAIKSTEQSLKITNSLSVARAARSQAVGTYKITKDPVKKREWARRIVVADQTIQSVRDVKNRLGATRDRLMMIKGDMELQLIEAETKAAEMKSYADAGNSLRLAGEKLMQARTRASKLGIEYDNLEVTMEGAENMASNLSGEQLLDKAEEIINRGGDEDDERNS